MILRNQRKKASKTRRGSLLGSKFKPKFEMLEDRRVLAAFTPGDVVVYRVGSITSPTDLVNTGAEVWLDEYSPSGTLVQSIALPASGTDKLIASGTATSEGLLSRSVDGQYLVLTGYNATMPTSNLVSTSGATANRVIGRVDGSGTVDVTTKFPDFASGNNPRSAASTDGIDLWMGGGTGGVRYGQFESPTQDPDNASNQLTTTPVNIRQVAIFNGQLYMSSASGANIGVNTVGSGVPTSGTQTATLLNGLSGVTTSPYAFHFADLDAGVAGDDTLYIADDAAGLMKFSLVAGTWTASGVVGVNADDYRGVTATVSAGTVTLFATRKGGSNAAGGGELVRIVDTTGYNGNVSSLVPTLLATASTKTAFRGVALVPAVASAPPVVTTTGSALSYNEDAGSVAVDPGLTVTDDGANLFGATVSITSNYVSGEDVLSYTNQNGISGSWNAATGIMTLSGTASPLT